MIDAPAKKCLRLTFFALIHLAVKINPLEVAYHLKFKQAYKLLSNSYDKNDAPAEPLLLLDMIYIFTLHLLQHHHV